MLQWFVVLLNDDAIIYGVCNRLWIGMLVVVSAPIGLAGALVLQQQLRPPFYLATIAPVLIPGVIIGISAVIFW